MVGWIEQKAGRDIDIRNNFTHSGQIQLTIFEKYCTRRSASGNRMKADQLKGSIREGGGRKKERGGGGAKMGDMLKCEKYIQSLWTNAVDHIGEI